MEETLFHNHSADISQSEKYNLSIQVNLDGFSVLISDAYENIPVYLGHTEFSLTSEANLARKAIELLEKQHFENTGFNSVSIIAGTREVRLLPADFASEKNMKLFLGYRKPTKNSTQITVPYTGKYNQVFSAQTELVQYLGSRFPGCTYRHETTPMLKVRKPGTNDCFFICRVYSSYIHILAYKGEETIFFNTFDYQSPNDIIYYLVAVIKQINLPEAIICINGLKKTSNHVAYQLKKYLPAHVINPPALLKHGQTQLPNSYEFELFPLILYNFS